MEHKVDRTQFSRKTLSFYTNLIFKSINTGSIRHTPYKNMQTANVHCASKEIKMTKDNLKKKKKNPKNNSKR